MSDSPQPRRHMRRGGWIALIVVVVLLSLMGGSYALGRSSSDPAATTVSAQPAAGTSSPRMMTWAQRPTDDVSWMRTHQADVRWMRNNADACDWGLPRSRARYWMNRPGKSGDSIRWEGWSHVREYVEEVPGRAA